MQYGGNLDTLAKGKLPMQENIGLVSNVDILNDRVVGGTARYTPDNLIPSRTVRIGGDVAEMQTIAAPRLRWDLELRGCSSVRELWFASSHLDALCIAQCVTYTLPESHKRKCLDSQRKIEGNDLRLSRGPKDHGLFLARGGDGSKRVVANQRHDNC